MLNENIDKAIAAHQAWVERAKLLAVGKLEEDIPSVSHKECEFGKMLLAGTFNEDIINDALEEIDVNHYMLHGTYKKIYEIMGNNDAPTNDDLNKADAYLENLLEASEELIAQLESSKQ